MRGYIGFSVLLVYLYGISVSTSTSPPTQLAELNEVWKVCPEGPKDGEFIVIHDIRMFPNLCTTYPEKECTVNSQIPLNVSARFTPKIEMTRVGAYLIRVIKLNPAAALGVPPVETLTSMVHFFQIELCDPMFNLRCPLKPGTEYVLKIEGKLPEFVLGKGRHIIRGKVKVAGDKEVLCKQLFIVYD